MRYYMETAITNVKKNKSKVQTILIMKLFLCFYYAILVNKLITINSFQFLVVLIYLIWGGVSRLGHFQEIIIVLARRHSCCKPYHIHCVLKNDTGVAYY